MTYLVVLLTLSCTLPEKAELQLGLGQANPAKDKAAGNPWHIRQKKTKASSPQDDMPYSPTLSM